MPAPVLVQLLRSVREILQRGHAGRPVQLRKAERLLLATIATGEPPADLLALAQNGQVRGLQSGLANLTAYLRKLSLLPEGLCAHYRYGQSRRLVLDRYRVSQSEWDFVHRLARETGTDMQGLTRAIKYEDLFWHDTLEAEIVSVEVVLDPRALDDMVVCALEAYLSPKKRKSYEVFGINLGMVRDVTEERKRLGTLITRYVSVMRSQPQLSAEGGPSEVAPSYRSVAALQKAAAALFPQYQLVGDFHSHVYPDMDTLRRAAGWEPSDGDKWYCAKLSDEAKVFGQPPHVDIVLAVAKCKHKVKHSRYPNRPNTIQVSVGDCRLVIGAHRILRSGNYTTRNARLTLPGTTD
ncbi:MAG: hypothetical protein JXR37_05080 [Kiritimatiellae bacterium]|nr:hypothetical protein [Kiritimatiellia bacterium]